MPALSQRQRRRPAYDAHEDEPPHRRRRAPAEEEEEEEEEADDGEGEEDEDDDDQKQEEEEEAAAEQPRSRRQRQSQNPRQTQSQGQRRRQQPAAESDDDNDDDDDDDNDEGVPQTQANRQQLHLELMTKKLVRYALACEPRRVPIRRQAIKEQVLDNEGKHFKAVFPSAQAQLRSIFGMEMVEWPARDETTMSVRERRKALKTKKQQPAGTQRTQRKAPAATAAPRMDRYVLLSTLSEAYREAVFAPIPADKNMRNPPASDAAYVGFCTLVVSLITLNGGSMPHADLEKYLTLLHGTNHHLVRAEEDFMKPMAEMMGDHVDDDDGGAAGTSQTQDGESVAQGGTLQHLVRQGYVVRVVEEAAAGGGGGGSSVHGGAKVVWHVGPRGRLEIGPAEVAAVVRHIYGPDANEEVERQLQSSLRAATMAAAAAKGDERGNPGGRVEQEQQRQRDEDEEDAAAED